MCLAIAGVPEDRIMNGIKTIRAGLNEVISQLKNRTDTKKAEEPRVLAESIAGPLYDIHLTGAREDAFRSDMKLYGRLSALANEINFKSTDQQEEVYSIFNKRSKDVNEKFKKFMREEITPFNNQLKRSELQILLDKKDKVLALLAYRY